MKVLVLGAGVIGVTTAYQLARDGHEVTVVDRRSSPAAEASGPDAALICPSHAAPWAAPGMRARTVHWLLQHESPLRLKGRVDLALIRWIMMWAGQCKPERYAVNRSRMHRLARYSLHYLQALRRSLGIQYNASGEGVLQLLRTEDDVKELSARLPLLDHLQIPYTVLNRTGCFAVDPLLEQASSDFLGGIYLPMDETGDCGRFTHALARHAETLGVRFLHDTTVGAAQVEDSAIRAIDTSRGRLTADRYVIALGAGSVQWLHDNGIALPTQRVKTYTLDAPVRAGAATPRLGIVDERNRISIACVGARIQATGMAELGSRESSVREERGRLLAEVVRGLYPNTVDLDQARLSATLYAATPDGPPVLGPGPWTNALFNLGHGFHAWTMACGSAKLVADLIAGRAPEIDLDGLTCARYPLKHA